MISIIIVDYKSPEFTKVCIRSVQKTQYPDKEIIVIDNSHNNVGLAAACNRGARLSKGDYLFFLNNDTIVRYDILDKLLESKTDITGCRMFDYSGKQELDSAISLDKFGCPAGKTGKIFYPDGAIFIKAKVFHEIGGFDERLFLYGEDRDLCWRAMLAGYSVGYKHSAVFYHNSNSISGTSYFQRYQAEKNIIRTMLKNYSLRSLVKIIPQYIFWSILELGLILFTRPLAIFKSYIPAYLWNIKHIGDTIRLRKKVIRRINDRDLPFSKEVGKFFVLRTMGVPKWRKRRYL